jgi:hypothetical protein
MKEPSKETSLAREAYEIYLNMGPSRSMRQVVEVLHSMGRYNGTEKTTLRHLAEWAKTHCWQDRIRAYEEEQALETRAKRQIEIDKMNQEHALIGRTQTLRMVKHIQELIEAKHFGSQAAVQLFKYATDLERVARGAATEQLAIAENKTPEIHTEDLSEEDLNMIVDMASKLHIVRDNIDATA